jgi:hypothetical protein
MEEDRSVKVPPDVQGFLDSDYNSRMVHDVPGVTGRFSNKYLNSGIRKKSAEY